MTGAEAVDQVRRLRPGPLPRHVAIIMDGNGRWAEQRKRPRFFGHAEGAKAVRRVVTTARESNIEALTLYAFSVQNWARPQQEVACLMGLLFDYLGEERRTILDNGIRLQGIGEIDRLPGFVQKKLRSLERESANNEGMTLSLALSYGAREDITTACRRLATEVSEGRLRPEDITPERLGAQMMTKGLPPVDLLVRTSGELRLSNFLLWECAYAEIVVTDVLWPDFQESHFFECIDVFRSRSRRFGLTGQQVASIESVAGADRA
jgi:undecaprenyl diphosphate synthase